MCDRLGLDKELSQLDTYSEELGLDLSKRAGLSRKWLKMVISLILLIRACNGLL